MSTDLLEVSDATVETSERSSEHTVAPCSVAVDGAVPTRSRGLRSTLSKAALQLQTDERLMELCQTGCDKAYEAIDERYRPQLVRYCTPMLGTDRAQDVAQQTLTQAFITLRNGEQPAKLRWWLLRVAHNFSIDTLRKKSSTYEQLDESFDGVPQPPALLEGRQRLTTVLDQINGLPERQRAALLLREFEGRSYDEIAAELDASPAVVSQLLQRARTSLRKAAACLLPAPLLRMLVAPGSGNPKLAELLTSASTSGPGLLGAGAAAVAAGIVTLGAGVAVQNSGANDSQRRDATGEPALTAQRSFASSNGSNVKGASRSIAGNGVRVGVRRPGSSKPAAQKPHRSQPGQAQTNAGGKKASAKSTPDAPVVEQRQLTAREIKQQKRAEKDANKKAAKQERNLRKREKSERKQVAAEHKRAVRQEKSERKRTQADLKQERQQARDQVASDRRAQRDAARQQQQAAREQAKADKQAQRDAARQQAAAQREAAAQQRATQRAQREAAKQQKRAARQQQTQQ